MGRHRHPNKEIEKALVYAEKHGWRVEPAKGHPHSIMYCPYNDRECRCGEYCMASVWSTPKKPETHAKQLRRVVDKCIRLTDDDETAENEG